MGQSLNPGQIDTMTHDFLQYLPEQYINVGIDDSILKYSLINSTTKLNEYASGLLSELPPGKVPDYVERVGGDLSGLAAVPHAVGVGALVISMILQISFIATKGSQSMQDSQTDMLTRIFADEKAFGVHDLMEEYLKRYKMYLRNHKQLLGETRHLERDLSMRLTELKNFMVVGGYINSRTLKYWINGAAFHAQMLIHIARLQKKDPLRFETAQSAASSAIGTHHHEISELLNKYKEYKRSQLKLVKNLKVCEIGKPTCNQIRCFIKDVDLQAEHDLDEHFCKLELKHIIEYIFSNHAQIEKSKSYFSKTQEDIADLCNEDSAFEFKT